MRDLVIILLIVISVIASIWRTSWAALAWVFVSVSSFHQQGYTTQGLPVGAAIAGIFVLGIVFRRRDFSIPWQPPVALMTLLAIWICIAYLASPLDENYEMWSKVMKVYVFTLLALGVLRTREDIYKLIWVIVLALCITGAKGGIFTLSTGGSYRVYGPGGFIGGNNEFALALVICIPLMQYLRSTVEKPWVRHALLAGMVLCAIAALGSHSRGALLALSAMALMLILNSKKRFATLTWLAIAAPLLLAIMPSDWSDRMATIKTWEQDQSATGRVNAWIMAWNLAWDRFFGGGFENVKYEFFKLYAPDTTYIQGPHSIYFQILGQHGFVAFFLFLGLGLTTWMTANQLIRAADPATAVGGQDMMLARMIKVSLIGFAVGGAFLALAYFDVPYYLMIALARLRALQLQAEAAGRTRPEGGPAPA
jgi:probable O-glycosylation ligase (exosortase A-associated)